MSTGPRLQHEIRDCANSGGRRLGLHGADRAVVRTAAARRSSDATAVRLQNPHRLSEDFMTTPTRRRSWLFTPATKPDRFDRAIRAGSDVLIIDLEDAVAPSDNAEAVDSPYFNIADDDGLRAETQAAVCLG